MSTLAERFAAMSHKDRLQTIAEDPSTLDALIAEAAPPAPTPLVTRLLAVAMFSANRKTMLDAPCAWCGYNRQGYYQQGTHGQGCPWHMVGGMVERDALLPEIIAATYAAPAPTPNESLCGCGYRQSLHWVDETGAIYCQLAEARHRALAAERIVDEALLAWHPAAPALPPRDGLFDKFPDTVQGELAARPNVFIVSYSLKGYGFGSYTFLVQPDGSVLIDDECSSRDTIKRVLGMMVDKAVLYSERDDAEQPPVAALLPVEADK